MKSKSAPPKYCKKCGYLHTGGIKDGTYNRWCCHFGQPAIKIWKHCKLAGGRSANN